VAFRSLHTRMLERYARESTKAIPVTGRVVLYGCKILRIPHCVDKRLIDGGKVVSPTHQPQFTPQKHYFSASGTRFC
jgi:hypothetical protein